jgi:5-methylcytosine-specific restriction endonuclease McrA
MVMNDRASVVEYRKDTFVHSANEKFQVPSVIAIGRYVKKARVSLKVTRKNLFIRDNYTCQYCDKRFTKPNLTIDHVTPKSAGGPKTWENIVAACKKCNQKKANKLPREAGMFPTNAPRQPSPKMFYNLVDNVDDSWRTFLDPYDY